MELKPPFAFAKGRRTHPDHPGVWSRGSACSGLGRRSRSWTRSSPDTGSPVLCHQLRPRTSGAGRTRCRRRDRAVPPSSASPTGARCSPASHTLQQDIEPAAGDGGPPRHLQHTGQREQQLPSELHSRPLIFPVLPARQPPPAPSRNHREPNNLCPTREELLERAHPAAQRAARQETDPNTSTGGVSLPRTGREEPTAHVRFTRRNTGHRKPQWVPASASDRGHAPKTPRALNGQSVRKRKSQEVAWESPGELDNRTMADLFTVGHKEYIQ